MPTITAVDNGAVNKARAYHRMLHFHLNNRDTRTRNPDRPEERPVINRPAMLGPRRIAIPNCTACCCVTGKPSGPAKRKIIPQEIIKTKTKKVNSGLLRMKFLNKFMKLLNIIFYSFQIISKTRYEQSLFIKFKLKSYPVLSLN